MADLKVERKDAVSREDAAGWLAGLAAALGGDSEVELPFALPYR